MTGADIVRFMLEQDGEVLDVRPVEQSVAYFDRLLEKGLVVPHFNKRRLAGFMSYWRTANPERERVFTQSWELPAVLDQGPYAYVDQVVVAKEFRNQGVLNYFIKYLRNLKPHIKGAFWIDENMNLHFEERSINMQTNCGVLAFDKVTGALNGRTNVISLSTLSRMAQDNGFLLFPMKIKTEDLYQLPRPFIVHFDFHFEAVKEHQDILPLPVWGKDELYVLAQTDEFGEIVDDDEARTIRGAKKFFKQIFMPFVDPFNVMAVRADSKGNHYPFAGAGTTLASAAGGALTGGPIGAVTAAIGSSLMSAKNPAQPTTLGGLVKSGLGGAAGGLIGKGLGSLGGTAASSAGNVVGKFLPPGVSSAAGTTGLVGGSSTLSSIGNVLGGVGAGSGGGGGAGGVTGSILGKLGGVAKSLNPFNGSGTPAGAQANSLFGTPSMGTLLGGGLLLKGFMSPQPQLTMPASLGELEALARAQAQGGGLSPAGQAAYGELNRGIKAGPQGIFPAQGDAYFDAALGQNRRIAARDRETLLNDINRIGGGVYSSQAQQQLNNFDETQRIEEREFIERQTELARQQGLQAYQNYIEMALQGDTRSYESLAQALGGVANADLAIQAFQAGIADGRSKQYTDLGGTLLGNSLDPLRQIAMSQLLGGR